MTRARDRRQRGFTLIEAVMVMVILSIAAVAIANQFSQTTRAWIADEELQTSTQLVQERMEGLLAQRRSDGYASLALGTVSDTLSGDFATYSRSVTVSSLSGNPCPTASCKQVVVTVSQGGSDLASATLMIADY